MSVYPLSIACYSSRSLLRVDQVRDNFVKERRETKTLSDQDLFLFRFHYGSAFTVLFYRVVFIRDREVRAADFVLGTR